MIQISNNNSNFLTPRQLQEEFGISISLQNKLRMRKNRDTKNGIPFSKFGKKILYKRESILQWIDNNEVNKQEIGKS